MPRWWRDDPGPCAVCKRPIPGPRLLLGAVTCSEECSSIRRKALDNKRYRDLTNEQKQQRLAQTTAWNKSPRGKAMRRARSKKKSYQRKVIDEARREHRKTGKPMSAVLAAWRAPEDMVQRWRHLEISRSMMMGSPDA